MSQSSSLPALLERMDARRLRAYREHLAFFRGDQWPGRARRGERRLTMNYARALIEKVTSYLLSGGAVHIEPLDRSDGPALERARIAERALREVEAANGTAQLDYETEVDCAVLGDAAYRVTWDRDEGAVRVSAPDIQGIFAWRVPDDPSRIVAVASRYQPGEGLPGEEPPPVMTEFWTRDRFERWDGDALAASAPNPYGAIPYVIFPNVREPKQTWGSSDIPPLMEPVRELNRAYSQLSQILELSGNPVAVLEGVHESRDIAVEPGAVWEMPESSRAYLLDLLQGGGAALHRDYIELVYRTLHDLGESPRTAFGHNPQGLSGVALNTELDPMVRKVERKRRIRGTVYERRAMLILRLLERYRGLAIDGVRPVMRWGPVLPLDRGRQVSDERALVEAGIRSRRSAAAELGVDDVTAEWERVLEEHGELGEG